MYCNLTKPRPYSLKRRASIAILLLLFGYLLTGAARAQSIPAPIPNVNFTTPGGVSASALQTDGKLIIAGNFTLVQGVPRAGLARLNADGSLDSTWAPSIAGRILTIALDGTVLYVSSATFVPSPNDPSRPFPTIIPPRDSQTNEYFQKPALVRVSVLTGEIDPSWHPIINGLIKSIAVSPSHIFIGGGFSTVNHVRRIGTAKIGKLGAGPVDPLWDPADNNLVTALLLDGPWLYVGRDAYVYGGASPLIRVSADGSGSLDHRWKGGAAIGKTTVHVLVANADSIYVGADVRSVYDDRFQISRITGFGLSKLSKQGGQLDSTWDPRMVHESHLSHLSTSALAATAEDLFVGDSGLKIPLRNNPTGTPDPLWPSLAASSVTVGAGSIYLGSTANGSIGVVKFDQETKIQDSAFIAQVESPGIVACTLRQPDGAIVVGGSFMYADGLARSSLARIGLDGSVDPTWAPKLDSTGYVTQLAVSGDEIVVAGHFQNVGGRKLDGLAKITMRDGAPDPSWNPKFGGEHISVNSTDVFIAYFVNDLVVQKISLSGDGSPDLDWKPDLNSLSVPNALPGFQNALANPNIVANDSHVYLTIQSLYSLPRGKSNRVSQILARADAHGTGAIDKHWYHLFSPNSGSGLTALTDTSLFTSLTDAQGSISRDILKFDFAGDGSPDPHWTISASLHGAQIQQLAVTDSFVYIAPTPSTGTDGQNVLPLFRYDVATGTMDPSFNTILEDGIDSPYSADGGLNSLVAAGPDLFVGGNFALAGVLHTGLALFTSVGAPLIRMDSAGKVYLTRNAFQDGPEVTWFQVTMLAGGVLFLPDGITPVHATDFVSAADGTAGLPFSMDPHSQERPSITAVSAVDNSPAGAGTEATTFALDGATNGLIFFKLAASTISVNKAAGSASVVVQKTGNVSGTVTYAVIDGTAHNGTEYVVPVTGTLSYSSTDASQTIMIPITNVSYYTGDRTFAIKLTGSSDNGIIADPAMTTVTIVDTTPLTTVGSLTNTPPLTTGLPTNCTISVILNIPTGGWRLAGDLSWHASGDVIRGLAQGNYVLEFAPTSGYTAPPNAGVAVTADGNEVVNVDYASAQGVGQGSLSVNIRPEDVANDSNLANRGEWRIVGATNWQNSGDTLSGLNAGGYGVEFKSVTGYATPTTQSVEVISGQGNQLYSTYFIGDAAPGSPPGVVDPATAATAPYAYVGEIRSDVGYGSGTVVQDRTVLTASHVLFDDETLSYVVNVSWYFAKYIDIRQSPPQTPRGWYVLGGYASERKIDESPDISTPTSQNLDVAALYFIEPCGGGSYAGYLQTDPGTQWLGSGNKKMIAGYPVEAITDSDRGKLFATDPSIPVAFTNLYQSVYSTTDIKSYPGNSGGPVFVQNGQGGQFYPAGIFFGGTTQTLVRAIDSQAVDLINRAELSANGGANSVGGGITVIGPGLTAASFTPTLLTVKIDPPEAVAAGAAWRVRGDANFLASGATLVRSPGPFMVEFKPTELYATPGTRLIQVVAGQVSSIEATYYPGVNIAATAHPYDGGRVTAGIFAQGFDAMVKAMPTPGYSFTNWTEDGSVVSTAANYAFLVSRPRSLVANFMPGPFVPYKGAYYGLISLDGVSTGFASISVNVAGVFSTAINYAGSRYAFKGRFDSAGNFSTTVGGQAIQVSLSLDLINGSNTLTGVIDDGVSQSTIKTAQTTSNASVSLPLVGLYTMALVPAPPDSTHPASAFPQGSGYGNAVVSSNGLLRLINVRLCDGTRISLGTGIAKDGTCPVFCTPYGNTGGLSGTFVFLDLAKRSDFEGELAWIKPSSKRHTLYKDGFATTLSAVGARYQRPARGARVLSSLSDSPDNLLLIPSGGALDPQPMSERFSLDANNQCKSADGHRGTLIIDVADGLFRGLFVNAGVFIPFGGAINQKSGNSAGFFNGNSQVGNIELDPAD